MSPSTFTTLTTSCLSTFEKEADKPKPIIVKFSRNNFLRKVFYNNRCLKGKLFRIIKILTKSEWKIYLRQEKYLVSEERMHQAIKFSIWMKHEKIEI